MSCLKKLTAFLAAAALSGSLLATPASALESYEPYSYDRWGESISSQVGYTADYFVDGKSIGCGSFKEPGDFYITEDEQFYIADKGNDRIVVTDLEFNLIETLTEFNYNGETLTLKSPSGVYVDPYSDNLYICDTDNARVIKCDRDGNVDMLFEKPASEIYSQELTFNPQKVVVDKAGNVYVVVKSVTKGAVMYNFKGEFMGFYGANRVEATSKIIMNAFWNLISTEEQTDRTARATPIGFTNFDIDDKGFIYTVTDSSEIVTDAVKKLSPKGTNILSSLGATDVTFGDEPPLYYSIYSKRSTLTDIDIGPNGEMNILDFAHGRIFQYDRLANLMFVMGGIGEQLGTFRNATSIESHDDKLYVLDSRKNSITVFTRTTFGNIVTEAINLYNDGYYQESYEPWCEVLKYDGNYRRAYIGIGNALFQNEDYKGAMKYYKIAIARARYSKAFEGYRNHFLEKYFTLLLILAVLLIVLIIVYNRAKKRGVFDRRRSKRRM